MGALCSGGDRKDKFDKPGDHKATKPPGKLTTGTPSKPQRGPSSAMTFDDVGTMPNKTKEEVFAKAAEAAKIEAANQERLAAESAAKA